MSTAEPGRGAARPGRVAGKVVLVTGAARGMGRSHALRLAEEGADLVVADICRDVDGVRYPMARPQDLADTARAAEQRGARVVPVAVDVRDGERLATETARAADDLGGLDAAVANAGVLVTGAWDSPSARDWRAVVDVNLIGVWHTCLAAIPHLVARGGGSLVNISSTAGIKGNPLMTAYTAAKHGVVGLSTSLANELAAFSVRVNTVHPAGVATGIESDLDALLRTDRPDLAPVYTNALPVRRVEPIDVSNAVVYLVSDESRYVTGTQLKVDAGAAIR
ncbi:mycofactocin-coupled SDR family oxidoreductase [Pseudonocardia sp.]|uniref:mycofactocin-coupled SDR family oxidoreductase n=1 Tax=Pseudonocardia sp. TaxID=60912 RepID=UPI003D10A25A